MFDRKNLILGWQQAGIGPDSPPPPRTAGGVLIPSGWNLQRLDTFGTANSVPGPVRMHALYNEAIFFGSDGRGLQTIPNSGVINSQQQTYQHFEDPTFDFMSDRLRIQGRGQPDDSIKSGQLCNKLSFRSWIIEARITAPSTLGSWVEYWNYATAAGGDTSELDVEIVISNPAGTGSNLDVHSVSVGNIPYAAITIDDSHITQDVPPGSFLTLYRNAAFNVSTGPHYHTILYDDTGSGTIKRYIDGVLLYHVVWKWNASLGGTGFGPDATQILDLAMGGVFPGNIATPSAYSGDLDIYSIAVYTPDPPGRPVPVGEAWSLFKTPSVVLSGNDLVATAGATTDTTVYALDPMTTGKYYWEVLLSSNSAAAGIGTYNSDASSGHYLGQVNSVGWYGAGPAAGQIIFNGSSVGTWAVYSGTPTRLCFSCDVVQGVSCKLWGRVGPTGLWNNDVIGNQNPDGDVGGYSVPFTYLVVPAGYMSTTGDTVTLVAASGSWAGIPPTGYGQIGPT